jgi:hypothetical protein
VIGISSNAVESPELVADRTERFVTAVGNRLRFTREPTVDLERLRTLVLSTRQLPGGNSYHWRWVPNWRQADSADHRNG